MKHFQSVCSALLQGQPPRGCSALIPLQQPAALNAETVAALQDMSGKTVTRCLLRALGWRSRDIIDPDNDEAMRQVSMWEPVRWGDLQLRCSTASVNILISIWNLIAQPGRPASSTPPPSAPWRPKAVERMAQLLMTHNGGLFLCHSVAWACHRRPDTVRSWLRDPIAQMAWPDLARGAPLQSARLFEADILPLLPRIAGAWPATWRQCHQRSQRSVSTAINAFSTQAARWVVWCRARRPDLRLPLAQGYADQLRRFDTTHRTLSKMVCTVRHTERKMRWDGWADPIEVIQRSHGTWKQAHALHPVDRSAADKIFLAGAAGCNLSHWAARGEQAMATLRGEIGALQPEAR